jgi:uncharacterized protein involved in tolerance to divalent cations
MALNAQMLDCVEVLDRVHSMFLWAELLPEAKQK